MQSHKNKNFFQGQSQIQTFEQQVSKQKDER